MVTVFSAINLIALHTVYVKLELGVVSVKFATFTFKYLDVHMIHAAVLLEEH